MRAMVRSETGPYDQAAYGRERLGMAGPDRPGQRSTRHGLRDLPVLRDAVRQCCLRPRSGHAELEASLKP